MTEQTSRLAVIIDSTGAEKNADSLSTALDKMADKGKEAAKSVENTGKAAESAAKSVSRKTKATQDESDALNDLLAKIRPTNSAMAELDRLSRQLSSAFSKGFINESQFSTYSTILDGVVAKTEKLDDELTGAAAAQRESAKAAKEASDQADAQTKALTQLEAKLSPVTAALKMLDDQQRQVSEFAKSGAISGAQYDAYSAKIAETRSQLTGEAQAERDATKAHDDQRASLQRLLAQLDPVNESLKRLESQQQQLSKANASGLLDDKQYGVLTEKISLMRTEIEKSQAAMGKATISSGQYKQALRQLPAQFTDIFTSIAGGMPLWLIFTQQGGQIADSFGGWGSLLEVIKREVLGFSDANEESSDSLSDNANALSENAENGKKLLGFLTPARVAIGGVAAAVGLLSYAYYQGSKEQDAFNQSLSLTGNVIGKTSGQLASMAQAVAANAGSTVSMASDVLNQLVASGKVASSSLMSASEAIIKLNDATGIATSQLVSDFNSIAGSPLEAITKLNDQYHFLTLSTYDQIKALQDQGNQQEAAKVANDAYSSALSTRADEIKGNLGALQTAWNDLGDAAKGAWDSMLDIGRESSPEKQLANMEASLADAKKKQQEGGVWNIFSANASGYNIPEMEKQVEALRSQIAAQGVLNGAISDYQVRQDKAIKTQQEADRVNQQYLSNADRRGKAIKQQSDFLKVGAITQEQYAKNVDRINDMYKDPKTPKGKAYSEDAGQKLLDQINEQSSALNAQLTTSDKLSTVTQQRIKFEQQIADIKNKSQLTADQKSLLARSDDIIQAYKAQEALQTQVTTLSDYQKMQDQVRTKEEKNNDLLRDRLALLEKAKATGALAPGEYDQTKANIYKNTPAELPSSVKSTVGNLTPTGGQLSGTFGGMQQQYGQLDQAQQQLQAWLQAQEDAYTKAGDITTEGEARMTAIRQQAAQANQAIETQKTQIVVSATQSMMDSGLSILATGFGEQSGIYKAAFAASKAFAIAQSLVAIQQGIAMAAANPFPYNIAAMASVAAATASIVSNLSAVADVGFKSGGYTGNMGVNSVAGAVHGQEYVFDAAATKKIGVSNLDSIRKNGLDATLSKQGFGTGAQNVDSSNSNSLKQSNVINQNFNMQGVTPEQMSNGLSQTAAKATTDALKQTAMQISKGTGDVGKAMRSAYSGRRTT